MPVELDRLGPDSYSRRVSPEKTAMLPAAGDPYKAAGSPDNDEVPRLVLVMGKDGFKVGEWAYVFLQYMYMSTGKLGFTAEGQVFRFVYADLQPKLVTVYGRNLLRICDYISLRRVPWIRQADRDFRGEGLADDDPVITRISITDWKPEESEAPAELQAVA